nr:PH domain-containing protein [Planosporangium mesophilum]
MPLAYGWDDARVRLKKFRHNAAITVAAVVAFFGAVPLATSRAYLLPIALVPILVGVWGWRAGTDVESAGLRIRALFGSRLVPWSHITALVPADRRRTYAVLTTGRQVRLPAVGAAELATFADTAAVKTAAAKDPGNDTAQ